MGPKKRQKLDDGVISNAVPKVPLEFPANSWSWISALAEKNKGIYRSSDLIQKIGEEELLISYRLHGPSHVDGQCKRNCKANPRCLAGLKMSKWSNGSNNGSSEETFDFLREDNTPCGLKNLGNTCYVNSVLQIWFHHPRLRRGVLQLKLNSKDSDAMEALQEIFALMSFSKRRFISPERLVSALDLDPAVQQDALEFKRLFFAKLEEEFVQSPDMESENLLEELFQGSFSYVTKCTSCKNERKSPENFKDIVLPISESLEESLDNFVKAETLEGVHCQHCQAPRNCTRKIKMETLPTILNVQLNRFVYDPKVGRKKINSPITFKEKLDLSKYVKSSKTNCTYQLTGLILHIGKDPTHGHYVVLVKDPKSSAWQRLNDEAVDQVPSLKGKEMKEVQCSVYFLVYQQVQETRPDDVALQVQDLSESLQQRLQVDREELEEEQSKQSQELQKRVELKKLARTAATDLVFEPTVDITDEDEAASGVFSGISKDDNFHLLPTKWIGSFFDDPLSCDSLDTSSFICTHGCVDVDKVSDLKAVNYDCATKLVKAIGIKKGQEMTRQSLCKACVENRCRHRILDERIAEASQVLAQERRKPLEEDKGFWIGKASLTNWKAQAKQDLAKFIAKTQGTYQNGKEPEQEFNSDIRCEHGHLCFHEGPRKLVSSRVWHEISQFFPNCHVFESGQDEPCKACGITHDFATIEQTEIKVKAASQKFALIDLFHLQNRPSWGKESLEKVFLVPKSFVAAWKAYVSRPLINEQISSVNNEILLCQHKRLLYPPTMDMETDPLTKAIMVTEDEWKKIQNHFEVDFEICIRRTKGSLVFESSPEPCDPCICDRLEMEEKEKLTYVNKDIFIVQIRADDEVPKVDNSDPDFNSTGVARSSPNPTSPLACGRVRKSSRTPKRAKVKGERAIRVNSSDTLKDLKIRLMDMFQVAPFDQNLYFQGNLLDDPSKTLSELGILPHNLIYLKVDEAGDSAVLDAAEEAGFKGTGLQSLPL